MLLNIIMTVLEVIPMNKEVNIIEMYMIFREFRNIFNNYLEEN